MSKTNLICPTESLTTVASSIKTKFLVDKTALVAYDSDLADPYIANFQLDIDAVNALSNPETIDGLMVDNTELRNEEMDSNVPYLVKLEHSIDKCIAAGTITATLKSFKLTPLKDSIARHVIEKYNSNFTATMTSILANKTALDAKGFKAADIAALQLGRDTAWTTHLAYGVLETQRSTLVINNNIAYINLDDKCKFIVNMGQSWSSAPPVNKAKKKVYVMKTIVKANVPAKKKVPITRHLKATQEIIAKTKMPGNHTFQVTKLSGGVILLGKSETKTGIPTATMPLVLNETLSLKEAQIPGTGKYIKLINQGLIKGSVKLFTIIP